jgi:hypothetical protein
MWITHPTPIMAPPLRMTGSTAPSVRTKSRTGTVGKFA